MIDILIMVNIVNVTGVEVMREVVIINVVDLKVLTVIEINIIKIEIMINIMIPIINLHLEMTNIMTKNMIIKNIGIRKIIKKTDEDINQNHENHLVVDHVINDVVIHDHILVVDHVDKLIKS